VGVVDGSEERAGLDSVKEYWGGGSGELVGWVMGMGMGMGESLSE